MSRGKELFRVVCDAADAAATVREMLPHDFRELYDYLIEELEPVGITGEVLGMLMVEATRRYVGAMAWGAKFERMKRVREVMG